MAGLPMQTIATSQIKRIDRTQTDAMVSFQPPRRSTVLALGGRKQQLSCSRARYRNEVPLSSISAISKPEGINRVRPDTHPQHIQRPQLCTDQGPAWQTEERYYLGYLDWSILGASTCFGNTASSEPSPAKGRSLQLHSSVNNHKTMANKIRQGTPLSSENDSHLFSLQHLVDHNNRAPSGRRMHGPDGTLYLATSQAASEFAPSRIDSMSPAQDNAFDISQYDQSGYHAIRSSALGDQYDSHGGNTQRGITNADSGYSALPDVSSNDREQTPPTHSTLSISNAKRTRSGRVVGQSTPPSNLKSDIGRSRVTKSLRIKAPRQKSSSTKAPRIDRPLSVLTKNMDTPLKDMDAWVNRSDETRQKEVEKKNGYIARPMNSFMMYRSAYAERTKVWCLQNNHQVVSAVSGESWPMEPPEIREKYNELARVERDNHARAHPTYKFSPSKNGPASRKKKDEFSDDEAENGSAIGNDDDEWRPRGERTISKRQRRDLTSSSSPFTGDNYDERVFTTPNAFGSLQWDVPTERGQFSSAVTHGYYHSPYFQQPAQQYMSHSAFVDSPLQDQYYGVPVGEFQSSYHPNMAMVRQQQQQQQLSDFETPVDPSLLSLTAEAQAQREEEDARYLQMGFPYETTELDDWLGCGQTSMG